MIFFETILNKVIITDRIDENIRKVFDESKESRAVSETFVSNWVPLSLTFDADVSNLFKTAFQFFEAQAVDSDLIF